MVSVTICSDFGAQENNVYHCFHCFPIYLPWSDGTGCHDLCFLNGWVLSQLFHSPLSFSFFFKWIYFNWRLITLQYCSGFCHTLTWISHSFHFHQEALQFLFAFCHKGDVICISEVIDISPGNLDFRLCFIQPGNSYDVVYIQVK